MLAGTTSLVVASGVEASADTLVRYLSRESTSQVVVVGDS